MIRDSSYWIAELQRQVEVVAKKRYQRRWSGASFARVERSVMLSCYALRKLDEAHKLDASVLESTIPLRGFPSLGTRVDRMNWHRLAQHYDLDQPNELQRSLRFVLNQVVHSFVFAPVLAPRGGLVSFLLNSDRTKDQVLFELTLENYLNHFFRVAQFYQEHFTIERLPDGSWGAPRH